MREKRRKRNERKEEIEGKSRLRKSTDGNTKKIKVRKKQ